MSVFSIINNTQTALPLSDSMRIEPGGTRVVDQLTLEMRRLEARQFITILGVAGPLGGVADDVLLPDYVGTRDPTVNTGGSSGTGDLVALTPAPDGSVPEWQLATNVWQATVAPRRLLLDGGNF